MVNSQPKAMQVLTSACARQSRYVACKVKGKAKRIVWSANGTGKFDDALKRMLFIHLLTKT